MKNKKNLIIALSVIAAAVAEAIISFLVLPEKVALQISFSGTQQNFVPKLPGVLFSLALTLFFAVLYISKGEKKNLVISLITLALPFVTFLMNI